jgi:hypothetical protein
MRVPNNAVRYHSAIIGELGGGITGHRANFNYTVRYRGEMSQRDKDMGHDLGCGRVTPAAPRLDFVIDLQLQLT